MTETLHAVASTSQTIADLQQLQGIPFREAPGPLQRRVYGVPYVQLDDSAGGQLWVTHHGWRYLAHLDPANWYVDSQYSRRGRWLSEGSGAVYRVSSGLASARPVDLVVKFSRMAQELSVDVSSRFPGGLERHVLDTAVFNDPFQEFGLLEQLRNTAVGTSNRGILTKRPLAIYSPARRIEPWQLGRSDARFRSHSQRLANDQATLEDGMAAVEMSMDRQYIYLFQWVRGVDAQSLVKTGELSSSEASALVVRVVADLAARGFHVLDTKPGHVILRRRPDGQLLRRDGQLVYALVDFELLQRDPRHTTLAPPAHLPRP